MGEFPVLADKTRRIGTLAVDEKVGANNEPRDSTDAITPAKESYARRMIGDLDDSADALLSLHEREANLKSHDEARIQSSKDDMYGALIFVRLPISLTPDVDNVVLIYGPPGYFIYRFFYFVYHPHLPRPSLAGES